MTIKATQIRKGQVLILDGELFLVTDFEHIAPGNWRAMNQIKCKNLKTGTTKQMRLGSDQTVELAFLDRRTCQFSYMDGEQAVFMDEENFEQYFLGAEFLGNSMLYVRENQSVTLVFFEGNPIQIDLPTSVVLKVTEAEMAVKGDTVTNDKKNAICDTGLKVRVPMFIEAGEWIKVAPETGEFQSRAKTEEAS